jgi:LmbE family N-acetylglucosaminyl deacetylase
VGTLISFHAHPDDESIATAGTMAKAKSLGHRVVLVVATRGDHGEPVPGVLDEGEPLPVRRTAETYESARLLGVDRVEFLGYVDSGMVDTPTSEMPWSFAQTPVDQAAARLAVILGEEQADVITTYDDNGGYGHPDHIQVHRVGARAAELVGLDQVFQSTINRTALIEGSEAMRDSLPEGIELPDFSAQPDFGKPAEDITHRVDVAEFTGRKRASMQAHRSQISETDFFLTMPDDMFARAFGTEWYIADGPAPAEGSLAAELFEPIR